MITDDLRQKIHSWLSTSDPSPNQNDATKLRELDTGLWFIDGMQFKEWKTAANSLLWLRGIRECQFNQAYIVLIIQVSWVRENRNVVREAEQNHCWF